MQFACIIGFRPLSTLHLNIVLFFLFYQLMGILKRFDAAMVNMVFEYVIFRIYNEIYDIYIRLINYTFHTQKSARKFFFFFFFFISATYTHEFDTFTQSLDTISMEIV